MTGIALVAVATIMLVGGTTVSLAPMNVVASSGGSSGDTIPALRQSNVIEKDGEVKHDKEIEANEHSSNAAEVTRDRTLEIDKDNTDDPANSWERTITTGTGDEIKQSGSSNENSGSAAAAGSAASSAASGTGADPAG